MNDKKTLQIPHSAGPLDGDQQLLDRRRLLTSFLHLAGGSLAFSLMGCAIRKNYALRVDEPEAAKYAVLKDLFVLRFTTDPGKPVEVLPVSNIAEGRATSFIWTERTHSHIYTVDQSHYERLKRGETIVITSDVQNNHTHSFMIDPKVVREGSTAMRLPLLDTFNSSGLEAPTPEDLIKILS